MSDVGPIRVDMHDAGVGVRVLSASRFAFPIGDGEAGEYVQAFNEALGAVVAGSGGSLVGRGVVSLTDSAAAGRQLAELAAAPGIAGVAIPPVLSGSSLDRGNLRQILRMATDLDLSVLVHPMQLPRPEWSDHYLANVIGNPTETGTAVAAVVARWRHRGITAAADLFRPRWG